MEIRAGMWKKPMPEHDHETEFLVYFSTAYGGFLEWGYPKLA